MPAQALSNRSVMDGSFSLCYTCMLPTGFFNTEKLLWCRYFYRRRRAVFRFKRHGM